MLEHNGEDELFRTRDIVTLFCMDSRKGEVIDTWDGTMERTEGGASRIIELEELLTKGNEEMMLVVTT